MTDRKVGFYWVKFHNSDVEPARFCRDEDAEWWEIIADIEGYLDEDFAAIGPFIEASVL